MSGIVCTLRGGPDTRSTISQAVTLARETSLPLHFLYVVNRELLVDTSVHRTSVSEQLRQMGSSIVLVAQAIANSHGVSAQGAVRSGYVEEEITELCQDIDADYLVLSRHQLHRRVNAFTQDGLTRFRSRIEETTGTKVVLTERNGTPQSRVQPNG